jgi:hypothetical protein
MQDVMPDTSRGNSSLYLDQGTRIRKGSNSAFQSAILQLSAQHEHISSHVGYIQLIDVRSGLDNGMMMAQK